jgi:hypothetical protein
MLIGIAPAEAAELYKWVDQNGVTNYSNEPPPKGTNVKPMVVPEDRLSVYTPEQSVTQAIERAKERAARPPLSMPAPSRNVEPERRALVPAPSIPPGYDPCSNPNDPNCQLYLYDGSPVFQGRRRPPVLVQPQLPPGTIAGNATASGGTIPGLSGTTPSAPPSSRTVIRSAPLRAPESGRDTSRH